MIEIKHIETYCSGCKKLLVATPDEIRSVRQHNIEDFTIDFNCPWCKKKTNTVYLRIKETEKAT